MKKLFIITLLTAFTLNLEAQKPGSWSVISPEGIYYQDLQQSVNHLKGRTIEDIALTPNGDLWIAAANNVYRVKPKESGASLDIDAIPSKANMNLIYGRSKIRPKIVAGFGNSVSVVISISALESADGENWQLIKTNPGADDIEGFEFDELTDIYASPYGAVVSGKKNNIPGLAVQAGGLDYFFVTEQTTNALGITSSFSFYDLNIDRDKVNWALGGSGKKHLWKIAGGAVQPVEFPEPILDITTDHNGRLVIATPTSIVAFDKGGNITPILETGALFVAFDNAGVIWYVPAHGHQQQEEEKEVESASTGRVRLSDMVKAAKEEMKQPAAGTSGQSAAAPVLLVRYDPATARSYELTADNSMIKGRIHKILSDKDNNKYILAGGEQKEIYIFKEPAYSGQWTAINPVFDGWDALNSNFWEASCTAPDGSFHAINRMVNGNYAVSVFSGGQWSRQPYRLGDAKLLFTVSGAAFLGETMYMATNNYLYALKNGKMEQAADMDNKALSNRILALAADSNGKLWIGSADGLASYNGKEFTYYGKKYTAGPASVKVLSLAASNGKVFVGTTDGLSVCDEQGAWTSFDKKTGLDNNRVNAVAADSKGRAFIGAVTAFGLSDVLTIYENGKITNEKIPQKIYINKMVTDANDNLWITGEKDFVCRKANGEYVFYNAEDTPLYRGYLIKDLSVVNGKVHISASKDPKGYQPTTSTTTITSASPDFSSRIKKGLNAFDPSEQVFQLTIDN